MNRWATTMNNRGIALVSVLWVMALLTVVAGGMSAGMKNETQLARNLIDAARARHAAEGGVHTAIAGLSDPSAENRWRADRSLHELTIGEAVVRVVVFNESGKVDLNVAEERLLDGLLRTAGAADWERPGIVDAILDWRDADGVTRLNGTEDGDYRAAGKPYGAKDAPFDSVEELQLIQGMTPPLYRAIKPALTVYSGSVGVNPGAASRQVLLAIPGINARTVDNYVAAREQRLAEGRPPPPWPLINREYTTRSNGTTYGIHAQARTPSGVTAHMTATVNLRTRSDDAPVTILSWRDEGGELFPRPQGVQ
ncbi:MAG: general secretion pathway protein GspK [Acidiferrobacterales bacterium]